MEHNDRLKKIADNILAPPGTNERYLQEKYLERTRTPEIHKEVEKMFKKYNSRFVTQLDNGSGLKMSSHLRTFFYEINDRCSKHGPWSMPSSFNIFEAFLEYEPELSYFRLQEEKEYIISMQDYFDYLTIDAEIDTDKYKNDFEEGMIYSFENDPAHEKILFKMNENINYFIEGISLIKYKQEFNIMASIGIMDDNRDFAIKDLEGGFTKPNIRPHPSLKAERVFIEKKFQQAYILFRLDLENNTQDAKYILHDEGNQFTVLTDDIYTFLDEHGRLSDEYKKTYTEIVKQIKEYEDIFETVRSILYINDYINYFSNDIKANRIETELRKNFKKQSYQKLIKYGKINERKFFREILILEGQYKKNSGNLTIKNPYLSIERSGYYKRLEPDQVGKDKNGKDIIGKTWVKNIEMWVQEIKDANESESGIPKDNTGYIYIMRNASHEKNIFKVGMTKRDPNIRSHELYSTGSPDHFLIAYDWWVVDRFSTEKSIHKYLDDYRLNERREFFKIEFKELIVVIDEIVTQMNKKSRPNSVERSGSRAKST